MMYKDLSDAIRKRRKMAMGGMAETDEAKPIVTQDTTPPETPEEHMLMEQDEFEKEHTGFEADETKSMDDKAKRMARLKKYIDAMGE